MSVDWPSAANSTAVNILGGASTASRSESPKAAPQAQEAPPVPVGQGSRAPAREDEIELHHNAMPIDRRRRSGEQREPVTVEEADDVVGGRLAGVELLERALHEYEVNAAKGALGTPQHLELKSLDVELE